MIKGDILQGIKKMKGLLKFKIIDINPSSKYSVKGRIDKAISPSLKGKICWINPDSFIKVYNKGDVIQGKVGTKSYFIKKGIVTDVLGDILGVKMIEFEDATWNYLKDNVHMYNVNLIERYESKFKKGVLVNGITPFDWLKEGEVISEKGRMVYMNILNTTPSCEHQIGKTYSVLNNFLSIIK